MLGKLLLLITAIVGYFWVKSWYNTLDTEARKKAIWNIAVFALIGIMLLAFLTGRMHWAGLAFAIVLGLLKFVANAAIRFSPLLFSMSRKHNFSTPQFKTRFLNVRLKVGDGIALDGQVIEGLHAGKELGQLSQDELVELANDYKDKCKRSYYLILVALQKAGPTQYQKQHFEDSSSVSREEAIQILGLSPDFTEEEVKLAHKKLIQKLHPDKGGNAWLAARINLAKATLLGK